MLLWMRHASYLVLNVNRITCRPFPLLENISLQSRLTMRITNHTSISIFETNFQHCPRVVRRVSWCFISRKWWQKFNYDCVTPLRPPYLYSHRFSGPPPRKSLGNRIIRMAGVLCGNVRFSTAARWSRWKYHFLLPITGVILIDNTRGFERREWFKERNTIGTSNPYSVEVLPDIRSECRMFVKKVRKTNMCLDGRPRGNAFGSRIGDIFLHLLAFFSTRASSSGC